jgi:hypothetical protein
MKAIGKLKINKEKSLTSDELLSLKGGYVSIQHLCYYLTQGGVGFWDVWNCVGGVPCSSGEAECQCNAHYPNATCFCDFGY